MKKRRIGGVLFAAHRPGEWLDSGEAFILLYLGEYRLWELSTNMPDETGPVPYRLLARAFTFQEIQEQSPDLTTEKSP